jgi:succinoglycan biosynthesis transport protein ExoP
VEPSQYLRLLRKRWTMIVVSVFLALAGGGVVILLSVPKYEARVKLFVAAADTQSNNTVLSGSLFSQQRVKSYADILGSDVVIRGVRDALGITDSVSALKAEVSASAPLDTVLVNVSVTDRSAPRAQAIANEVGKQFAAFADQLETPQGQRTSPVKVTVVEPAELPASPVSPKKKLDLALALLLGLGVGVVGAALRESLDTTVKRPDEAQAITESTVLGLIAYDPEAPKTPLVVEVNPHSTRAEAFRQLRTNLQFIDVDKPARSIVVTSALPKEGKTTTTINLALTLARAGKSVCLIEGDLRRPRVGRYLGMPEDLPGLTDVLIGTTPLNSALVRFRDTAMVTIPAGARPPNPSELLGSDSMRLLMEQLHGTFDVVIIDAPPLLPVTDAGEGGPDPQGATHPGHGIAAVC